MFTSIYCMDKIKNDGDVAKMYDHIRENGLKLSFQAIPMVYFLYLEYNIIKSKQMKNRMVLRLALAAIVFAGCVEEKEDKSLTSGG